MGILSGSIACTRFNAAVPPEGPDFDAVSFRAIEPGSEVRERAGVIPWEPGAPYEVAKGRYAFRVRIDRRRPDPTAVRERLRELVAAEREATGAPFVGPKKRKELKELAERELIVHQAPKIQVIECVLDGAILYVGSTAKSWLGMVLALLRQAEVAADWKAPEVDETSDIVVPKEPGQSVLGCRFLRALLEESEVMVEPETGSVRLATRETRVTLAGGVLPELVRYLESGAEILAAKIHLGAVPLRFDALSYRLSGVQLEAVREEHWTLSLDARLEQLAALWAELDGKYAALTDRLGAPAATGGASAVPPAVGEAAEAAAS
jgi:hypothetical protein